MADKRSITYTGWAQTEDSNKVKNYLTRLKKGSKIHIATLATKLGVKNHVVLNQLERHFKGKFDNH